MNPLLEPDEELAPKDVRFRLLHIPPRTLEVTQQQVHAVGGSNSSISVIDTLRLLFVGLSRSGKLGEHLKTKGELFPASQGGIRRETLADEVCGECK